MEEHIIYKSYNASEADRILAECHDAGIPAYKSEQRIRRLQESTSAKRHTSIFHIIVPEKAEDKADEILIHMGLMDPPSGAGNTGLPEPVNKMPEPENLLQTKTAILDDFAMAYETAVLCLCENDYLEQFYDFYFLTGRTGRLIPVKEGFQEAFAGLCGETSGKSIADQTENLFGCPERIMVFEETEPVVRELEACSDGWGPFYIVFDLLFCEYKGFMLCFISGSNN